MTRKAGNPPRYIEVNGCWEWQGALNECGYAIYQDGVRGHVASRLIYKLLKGHVYRGKVVRHTCDNRRCINPAHLEVGTHKDNSADAIQRGRHSHGEKHPRAKLDDEAVKAIRRSRLTSRCLGEIYGVSHSTILNAKSGYRWRHVDDGTTTTGGNDGGSKSL